MNINATLIAQAVVMIVFVAICWRYIYPPIVAAMQERQKKISDGLEAAKKRMILWKRQSLLMKKS